MVKEAKVFAVGTENGKSVIFLLVDGIKTVVPTSLLAMSKLAEKGIPIRNETRKTPDCLK